MTINSYISDICSPNIQIFSIQLKAFFTTLNFLEFRKSATNKSKYASSAMERLRHAKQVHSRRMLMNASLAKRERFRTVANMCK